MPSLHGCGLVRMLVRLAQIGRSFTPTRDGLSASTRPSFDEPPALSLASVRGTESALGAGFNGAATASLAHRRACRR